MQFWKRKQKDIQPTPVVAWLKDKAKWANMVWAGRMASLAGRLTLKQQKIAAFVFCAFSALLCLGLMIKGFLLAPENTHTPVKAISAPRKIRPQVKRKVSYEKDREKVLGLRHYLDSLKQDPEGRQQFDSLRHYRPGLLDTLEILEHYYQSE